MGKDAIHIPELTAPGGSWAPRLNQAHSVNVPLPCSIGSGTWGQVPVAELSYVNDTPDRCYLVCCPWKTNTRGYVTASCGFEPSCVMP